MPRNGSGQYIPLTNTWNPPVTGVLATGADFQAQLTDIAAAITQSLSKDGQTPMTGNLPMNNNSIVGVVAGTAAAPSISPTGDTNTGVYFPAADQVAISTGGTQRVVVNNAGYVGIGTSTPGDAFTLSLGNARIQKDVPQLRFNSLGDVKKWFIGANINDSIDDGIHFGAGGGIGAGTTHMRIDSSGNLLVGTAASQGKAVINGRLQAGVVNSSSNEFALVLAPRVSGNNIWNLTAGAGNLEIRVGGYPDQTQNQAVISITASGILPSTDNAYTLGTAGNRWNVVYAATGTINTSDEREKLDFADTLGLDFILKLEPVSYRYKNGKTVIDQVEDGVEEVPAVLDEKGNEVTPATTRPKYKHVERIKEGKRRHHGLKAQQVKQTLDQFGVDFAGWILTDLENSDSEQGLRYDQFIAPLIKSIKEQQSLIESLAARIAALEAK